MSPLTCAGLCDAGAAPGSLFIPSPRPPWGICAKVRAGRGGAAGGLRPARSWEIPRGGACWGPACLCVHTCACVCVCTRVCAASPVPAAGDSPGAVGTHGTRVTSSGPVPGHDGLGHREALRTLPLPLPAWSLPLRALPFARRDTSRLLRCPRAVGGLSRGLPPQVGAESTRDTHGPSSIPRHRVAAVSCRVLAPPCARASSRSLDWEGTMPSCLRTASCAPELHQSIPLNLCTVPPEPVYCPAATYPTTTHPRCSTAIAASHRAVRCPSAQGPCPQEGLSVSGVPPSPVCPCHPAGGWRGCG